MARRILVLGMNAFDSGKTNLAMQLSTALQNSGATVEYFKPVSGHNYWYRYEHTKHCIQTGNLVSYDAVRARRNIESSIPMELANPVHTLWVPANIDRPGRSPFNTLGLAGWDAFLGMQRFTRSKNGELESTFIVAKTLIDNHSLLLNSDQAEKIIGSGNRIPVENMERAQEVERSLFENTVDAAFRTVEKNADVVIIESFNDSVWPWKGLDSVDETFIVGPGQMFEYEAEKIRKAAFLSHRDNVPIREVTFSRIADLVRPQQRYQLKPEAGLSSSHIDKLLST